MFAGECDLAIANTYYMGKMMTNEEEPEQKEWAKAVKIIFPSSPEFGTHVNISGVLLAKNAPNKDNAIKFMEFLASDEAQRLYADGNFEYPVNPAIPPSDIVKSWGTFTPDTLNVAEVFAPFLVQCPLIINIDNCPATQLVLPRTLNRLNNMIINHANFIPE